MTAAARIGPNAITRVAEVLGPQRAEPVFRQAGLARYLQSPPEAMVDEGEVIALHAALREQLGEQRWFEVARAAGERTAAYLLAHRIPALVQRVLRLLPSRLAARALLRSIGAHAWTFAGSGEFSAEVGRSVKLTIRNNPMCRGLHSEQPCCRFYAAVFEVLFRTLVHPQARVAETQCEARGDPACCFEVRWP